MLRNLAFGVLIAATLPAPAAAIVGPPIAYGASNTIYLVNPDGTGLRALYSAGRKASLTGIDLRRGGGQIAIIENHQLKVLDYDDRGVAIGSARTISFPCGTILEADYGADGSLAAKDGCFPNHIWRVAPGASVSDAAPLVTESTTIGDVDWSRDGARIYYESADGLRAYDVASETSSVIYPDHSMWDVTTTGDRLILASTNWNYFVRDLASGTDTPGCTQGYAIHYGNNDTQMVYRTPTQRSAFYILVTNSDCSGAPFRITGKAGAYLGPDWAAP